MRYSNDIKDGTFTEDESGYRTYYSYVKITSPYEAMERYEVTQMGIVNPI